MVQTWVGPPPAPVVSFHQWKHHIYSCRLTFGPTCCLNVLWVHKAGLPPMTWLTGFCNWDAFWFIYEVCPPPVSHLPEPISRGWWLTAVTPENTSSSVYTSKTVRWHTIIYHHCRENTFFFLSSTKADNESKCQVNLHLIPEHFNKWKLSNQEKHNSLHLFIYWSLSVIVRSSRGGRISLPCMGSSEDILMTHHNICWQSQGRSTSVPSSQRSKQKTPLIY